MITSRRPCHPELRKYIDYYYFQDSFFSKAFTYQYFPNLHTTISVYRNSISHQSGERHYVLPSKKQAMVKLLTTPQYRPATVIQSGRIAKIAIVFYCHGINYFIEHPLGNLTTATVSPLQGFDERFDSVIDLTFEAVDIKEKVELLDSYFLQLLRQTVHPMFERARLLLEQKRNYTLTDIAGILQLNRRSIFKWFKLFTNCSPEHYRNIGKFRASVQRKLTRPELLLTEIAHEHYADQSHFIKRVKQHTHLTPLRFFEQVQQVGELATFWAVNSNPEQA